MAANASVAVARLGGIASYWGRVGADDVGARILRELADEGVDVSSVRRVAGAASSSDAILVDAQGERLICAFTDPALDPDPSWLPLESVAQFDAVLADVRWPAGAAALFDTATALGIPAIFDGDVGPARCASRPGAARHAHCFLRARLGPCGRRWRRPAAHSSGSQRRCVASSGSPLAPMAFSGATARSSGESTAPRVDAIDTLAAGDVWHGAFALGLGEKKEIAEAARFANAAAALKCTRTRRPTRHADAHEKSRPF